MDVDEMSDSRDRSDFHAILAKEKEQECLQLQSLIEKRASEIFTLKSEL